MNCGEKIVFLRKEKGMTQAELGSRLNVTYQAVSKWERGESYPDFETMSKIAKIFGVPLSYFEDDEVIAAVAAPAVEPKIEATPSVGACVKCGKTVYSDNVATISPQLICKSCWEKSKTSSNPSQQSYPTKTKYKTCASKGDAISIRRKRGFIGGILFTIAVLLIMVIAFSTVKNPPKLGVEIAIGIVIPLLTFTYMTQILWGGILRSVSFWFIKRIAMPGIIFSLSLDGLEFLIAMKIIFAVLEKLIFLATFFFSVAVAVAISPFTFFPTLINVNDGRYE